MAAEPWAGLAEAVGAVRAELQTAMAEGKDQELRFTAGPVEMEFAVDIRRDGEARVKVFVLPWTAEAQGAVSQGTTHRLKIVLQPVDSAGADAIISADSPDRPR